MDTNGNNMMYSSKSSKTAGFFFLQDTFYSSELEELGYTGPLVTCLESHHETQNETELKSRTKEENYPFHHIFHDLN